MIRVGNLAFAFIMALVLVFVVQDCVHYYVAMNGFQKDVRRAYEKCERQGIPRSRCPL